MTHEVLVIRVPGVAPHPNAHSLEIVRFPETGYQVVVRKGQFKAGDAAVYVEPDYEVPLAHPAFAFLRREESPADAFERIRVRRFRGEWSQGLLVPAQLDVGVDVCAAWGIRRWELPDLGDSVHDCPPKLTAPSWDCESYRKFHTLLDNVECEITEKIHGMSARFVWADGRPHFGTRTAWLKPDIDTPLRRAFDATPSISAWCEANAGCILYGEVYGHVQDLRYGAEVDVCRFAAFAVFRQPVPGASLRWERPPDSVPTVPVLWRGVPTLETVSVLAEQDSVLCPGQCREGCVVRPLVDIVSPASTTLPLALKLVSNRYLER